MPRATAPPVNVMVPVVVPATDCGGGVGWLAQPVSIVPPSARAPIKILARISGGSFFLVNAQPSYTLKLGKARPADIPLRNRGAPASYQSSCLPSPRSRVMAGQGMTRAAAPFGVYKIPG